MQTSDFDFSLPPELIAQQPAPHRDQSRLLVLHRASAQIAHRQFSDLLEYLHPGDLLVLNDSRVIPARLRGLNEATGGQLEVLLVEEVAAGQWWALLRPGKRARVGAKILILDKHQRSSPLQAVVREINPEGHRLLQFSGPRNVGDELESLGEIPLPPYIRRPAEQPADRERYQTVYANPPGSVAAPTAGLHFTPELLDRIRARGVETRFVTLHVGLGTFAPVKTEDLASHVMHDERFVIGAETARAIAAAKNEGRRVWAVGTTTVRVLESAARAGAGHVIAGGARTSIFIHPPFQFQIVDALVTNFHLPRSTLLMLASAFAAPGGTEGRALILRAYREAISQNYRFFSYGDAMLLC